MSCVLAELHTCRRCPRLAALHEQVRQTYPGYHAAPVGAWGDARARLIIVGLAPGLHGATRTGRAFVGDASGTFLFAALNRQGFASHAQPDKARLHGVRITNAVKCLPPGNAPSGAEVAACAEYLHAELEDFCPAGARLPRVLITLGGVAHRAVCRSLGLKGAAFRHAASHPVSSKLTLISSFHPSRLNVNTGRLTAPMMDEVFALSRTLLA